MHRLHAEDLITPIPRLQKVRSELRDRELLGEDDGITILGEQCLKIPLPLQFALIMIKGLEQNVGEAVKCALIGLEVQRSTAAFIPKMQWAKADKVKAILINEGISVGSGDIVFAHDVVRRLQERWGYNACVAAGLHARALDSAWALCEKMNAFVTGAGNGYDENLVLKVVRLC